jgi:hypothetical protein
MQQTSSERRLAHHQPRLRKVLVAFLGGILCYYLGARLAIVHVTMAQDKVVPFVLMADVYAYEHDPKRALAITNNFGRRSDGAFAMFGSYGPIALGITARSVSYWDGTSKVFVDAFRTKTTKPAVPPSGLASYQAHLLNGPPNCLRHRGEIIKGTETLFGQPVVIVEEDGVGGTPQTVGGRRTIEWRAPNLKCHTLAYTVEDKRADGTWWLRTKQRVVSLTIGEPPRELFEDKPEYTEASHEEVLRQLTEEIKRRGQ